MSTHLYVSLQDVAPLHRVDAAWGWIAIVALILLPACAAFLVWRRQAGRRAPVSQSVALFLAVFAGMFCLAGGLVLVWRAVADDQVDAGYSQALVGPDVRDAGGLMSSSGADLPTPQGQTK